MTASPVAHLRRITERLRASLWFIPTLAVVAAIIGGTALSRMSVASSSWVSDIVFAGGAEGARGMLQAVAGSVITVTSLVFSLTVVTLQLASSQFSPRLLRTFLSDRGNQIVLAVFLATFAYSLTVLRTIRSGEGEAEIFVPQVAVSGAFLLVLASVAALVYFIHHITQEIQVDTMMREVERETRRTIDAEYPESSTAAVGDAKAPAIPEHAVCVPSDRFGFIQFVDVDRLARVAVDHGIVIRPHAAIGEAVAERAPFAWLWCDDGGPPPPESVEAVRDAVHTAIQVGHERTPQEDVGLGLRQLADIAVKAMSPSINDPTTAVHAIGHLTSLLCVLASRDLGDAVIRDDHGTVRVAVIRPGFDDYLDLACGQIRRFGAGEANVAKALLWMLREVAGLVPATRQDAVRLQADLVYAAAQRELPQDHDVDQVRHSAEAVHRALAGDQRP